MWFGYWNAVGEELKEAGEGEEGVCTLQGLIL